MIRLTYANVASTVALALALGGTSYAAVHLGRGVVKNANIASNAVTSTKVKDGSLLAKDIKAGQFLPGVIIRHTQRAQMASLDGTPLEVAGIGPPGAYSGSYSTALVQPADWNYMAVNAQVHVTVTAGTGIKCQFERRINGGTWTEIAATAVPDAAPRQGYMAVSFPWFTPNSIIEFRVLCETGGGSGTLTGAEIGVEAGKIA